MIDEVKNEITATLAPLLSDIVKDSQSLIRQELALAKSELSIEMRKIRSIAFSAVAALLTCLLSLFLLGLGIVHLLSWLLPSLALWKCFLLVSVAFALLGYGFCVLSQNRLSAVDITLPITRESIKEMTNA